MEWSGGIENSKLDADLNCRMGTGSGAFHLSDRFARRNPAIVFAGQMIAALVPIARVHCDITSRGGDSWPNGLPRFDCRRNGMAAEFHGRAQPADPDLPVLKGANAECARLP